MYPQQRTPGGHQPQGLHRQRTPVRCGLGSDVLQVPAHSGGDQTKP